MSTKLFLLFVFAAVGTLFGYFILLSYRRNYTYLDGVCKMIDELKCNLSYKKDTVAKVLGSMTVASSQLKKNIGEYTDFVSGKTEKPVLSRGFLPKSTFDGVTELFTSLGRSDENSQDSQLAAFRIKFDKLCNAAEQKYAKLGATAVKLGFLLGLGLGILLI